jgi:DNA mismatch endonuclease (patch repair protein)
MPKVADKSGISRIQINGCIPVERTKAKRRVTDIVDKRTRSRMMAGIRGKNTKPELSLRRALHALGFRYRLHAPGFPGRPDLVLAKHRAAIFVHGCFWHRHPGCRYTTTPATRPQFWAAKFEANIARSELLKAGWRVGTVWACALRTETAVGAARDLVAGWLHGTGLEFEVAEADTGQINPGAAIPAMGARCASIAAVGIRANPDVKLLLETQPIR